MAFIYPEILEMPCATSLLIYTTMCFDLLFGDLVQIPLTSYAYGDYLNMNLFSAFKLGFLCFLSPYTLPFIIPFLSLVGCISWLSLFKIKKPENSEDKKWEHMINKIDIFCCSCFFMIGIITTFIATGTVLMPEMYDLTLSGRAILILNYGGLTLFLSLIFILLKLKFISPRLNGLIRLFKSVFVLFAFAFGFILSIEWGVPHINPYLNSIMLAALLTQKTIFLGALLLLFYWLGLGIPFFLAAFAFNKFLIHSKYILTYRDKIFLACGLIMALVGILLLTGYLNKLSFLFLTNSVGKF